MGREREQRAWCHANTGSSGVVAVHRAGKGPVQAGQGSGQDRRLCSILQPRKSLYRDGRALGSDVDSSLALEAEGPRTV